MHLKKRQNYYYRLASKKKYLFLYAFFAAAYLTYLSQIQ